MLTKTQTAGKNLLLDAHQRLNAAMRACVAWAAIEEHDKILDMACGDGQLLSRLNDQLRLTLCGMCETADQARCVSEILGGADVIPARMEDIPWRDDTFDVILLSAGMRGDARRVLEEVARALRPGGQFVMASSVIGRPCEGDLSRREIMRLMQESGFREVSFRMTGLCGAIVGWKKGKIDQ
jgi:ubiquinone/menaquinone biosynthesis C-methylase UbiE